VSCPWPTGKLVNAEPLQDVSIRVDCMADSV